MATTLEQNTLEAQPREAGTKNQARRVRRDGKIPAVVYGAGKESLSISVDPRHVTRILNSETGHNTIFDLALNGGERTKAMIVDWQYEPIKGHLLHIDLKRIALDKKLTVIVPIDLEGEPAGVKQQGGILEQMLREVEIECLPADIPSHIDADVSHLTFGKVLRVSELPHSDKIKFITDENQPVAPWFCGVFTLSASILRIIPALRADGVAVLRAVVLLGQLVNVPPGLLAADGLDHVPADLGPVIRVVAVDQHGDARIAGDVPGLLPLWFGIH